MDKYIRCINCILKLLSADTEILYISEKIGTPCIQLENHAINIGIRDFISQPSCPDTVLYDKFRNQIIFISFSEISGIFTEEKVKAGEEICHCPGTEAVFITAFQTTDDMLADYQKLAVNTNVWTADAPDHKIVNYPDLRLTP